MSHTLDKPQNRRKVLQSLLYGGLLAVHSGAAHSGLVDTFNQLTGRAGTLHILALDITTSINGTDPRDLYPQLSRSVLNQVEPGDILLLLPISDQGQSTVAIQKFEFARTGKNFEDRKNRATLIKTASAAIDDMVQRKPSKLTRLIEDFAALKPEVAAAVARGMAVKLNVASDMLESSKLGDMEKTFSAPMADALFQQVQRKDLLLYAKPSTSSDATLRVIVVGAGGSSPETYQAVEAFWRKYFAASGFTVAHYGRTVPSRI